jgi:alanine-glyoxylate transaminase/serine-glyoxylate transaminase/serine-pyruvate transaminase
MVPLPATDRILLGPGPSMIAPRVLRAMGAPVLSHLDPEMLQLMDEVRERLARLFQAPPGSFAFTASGTGTAAMEMAVANLVGPGTRATVCVTGYFSDRLALMCERYGAQVTRVEVPWGRAADPQALRAALSAQGADVVGFVHAETSTGVCSPAADLAAVAREHGAVTICDAVTSLGGHPVDVAAWGIGAAYSCAQKCVGAPSGLAPLVFSPEALARRVPCRSFYLDVALLEDYWLRRKYHHTMCSSLIYAVREALAAIDDEGLEARWARHARHHQALVAGLEAMGLSLLAPPAERLWTLNAVSVPSGIDEAAVRRELLARFNIEVGAGLGPLAGKIWRVGLMGASSTPAIVLLFLGALDAVLAGQGHAAPRGAGGAAAAGVLG